MNKCILILMLVLFSVFAMGASCGGSSSRSTTTYVPGESIVAPIPEPTAALTFGVGLLMLARMQRRKR